MLVVLLQILQWILRIILFLLLLIIVLVAIIMIVPIRYQAEGEYLEKKLSIRGKVTWFFYLIHMKFAYEEELHIVVRLLGFKVYDSGQELACEQEQLTEDTVIIGKIDGLKAKIQSIILKVQDFLKKIQDGKLKVEHYLEILNRKETRITFERAKKKLGKVFKSISPRKWEVIGNVGFSNPATTGQLMGILGAMYPLIGNRVRLIPDFEEEVLNVEGNAKGHVTLGNITYQVVSLLLNINSFKFIKMILDELSSSKNKNKSKETV